MRINELFDSKYPYKWTLKRNEMLWQGLFYAKDGTKVDLHIEQTSGRDFDVAFYRDNDIETTGGGDQFNILSTIIAMVQEFAQHMEPDSLRFTASKDVAGDGSRVRLYRKLAQVFAKDYSIGERDHWAGDGVEFTLTRNNHLGEDASSGATAAGSVAVVVGALGAGFDGDYSKSIYGTPVMIRRGTKPKKAKKKS